MRNYKNNPNYELILKLRKKRKQKKAFEYYSKAFISYSLLDQSGKYPRMIPRLESFTNKRISSRSGEAGISASIISTA